MGAVSAQSFAWRIFCAEAGPRNGAPTFRPHSAAAKELSLLPPLLPPGGPGAETVRPGGAPGARSAALLAAAPPDASSGPAGPPVYLPRPENHHITNFGPHGPLRPQGPQISEVMCVSNVRTPKTPKFITSLNRAQDESQGPNCCCDATSVSYKSSSAAKGREESGARERSNVKTSGVWAGASSPATPPPPPRGGGA